MNNLLKTPVTIITGFLGSGKTTLITNLMHNFKDGKLAIIVNEFGDIGVDGEILKSCSIPNCPEENIIELSNGCICCTVADDFIPTMSKLLEMEIRPDQILIETSGLALPKPLLKAFQWPQINSQISIDSVITLADAEAVYHLRFAPSIEAVSRQRLNDDKIDHESPLSEVFEDQINCADIILLTKCDIVNKEELLHAKSIINKIKKNDKPILEVTKGKINPKMILDLMSNSEKDLDNRPSHHDDIDNHDHEDFETFVHNIKTVYSAEQIIKKIETLTKKHEILRIKGYIAIKNKPMRYLIQAVGSRVRGQYDKMWNLDDKKISKLIFIAEKNKITPKIIENYLK